MCKVPLDFPSSSTSDILKIPHGHLHNPWHRAFCVLLSALLVAALIPASALAAPKNSSVPSQEPSGLPLGSGEATYGAPADAKKDPMAEVKPQKKDPNAKRVREIIEDRSTTTSTYVLSDGRYETVVSPSAIHYEKSPGNYVDISTALIPDETTATPGALQTLSTPIKTTFSPKGKGAVTLSTKDYSLSLGVCGAKLSQPLALGNTALYLDAGDNTSLSYQALADGVKETLVLNKPTSKDFYDFRLDFTGLALRQDTATLAWKLVKNDGSVAFQLSDLVVTDSNYDERSGNFSQCSNTSWELISSSKTSARFRAHLDKSWLISKDRVWPVKIDPSATIAVSQDSYVGSAYATTNYNTATELRAGYLDATTGTNRSYLTFSALPSLAGANIDSVTFKAYQTDCYSTAATTSYLAQASAAIPSAVTWNTKPAMSAAIASTSITGKGVWATYDVTSALSAPLTTGSAFYGLVLYQDEAAPSNTTWRKFSSNEGSYKPYLTITYSTKTVTVTGLNSTLSAFDGYFKETDKNGDGIADNYNDYPDLGRGAVNLSWNADPNALGYHIYLADAVAYHQVGTTIGKNSTTWSSSGAGIFPKDSNYRGLADNSVIGNLFLGNSPGNPAQRTAATTLTYPAATPFTSNGAGGSGLVVAGGKYVYVKSWAANAGPAKWVRFAQTNAMTAATPTYDSGTVQATADAVPQSESAFMLNGILYDGAITAATATTTTIAAYAADTFDNPSAHRLDFSFDQPLLGDTSGTPIAAGTIGWGIRLTTDGTYIYSVGKSGTNFAVRQYDDTGHFISNWTVPASGASAFSSYYTVACDKGNIYLFDWTNTNAARTYKVSLATHQIVDVWIQTEQATLHTITFTYDATNNRFIGGNHNSGANLYYYKGSGLDLRDNPNAFYRKFSTSTPGPNTNINYWFRVVAYDNGGELDTSSGACTVPTLEKRSVTVAEDTNPDYVSIGSVGGVELYTALNAPNLKVTTTDFTLSSYGPQAAVQKTFRNNLALTSAYLPKGWWFSFEQKIDVLSSGVARYIDDTGQVHLFAPDTAHPNTYISPAGMFSTLVKTSSGWTLTDKDLTQHTFDNSGAITADIDRIGNTTTYSLSANQVTITAANGQVLTYIVSSATSSQLSYTVGSFSDKIQYDISGTKLTTTEHQGSSLQLQTIYNFTNGGSVLDITRGSDFGDCLWTTNSIYLFHSTTPSTPNRNYRIDYSARSANVVQALLTKGSVGTTLGYAGGQEKTIYLADPTGQTLFASTSADQAYGTATTYNAYNQVISIREPVAPSADGLSFTDAPTTVGVVGSMSSDYDSAGNLTYSLDKSGLETWNYYNAANDLIKTIGDNRAVTWYSVDSKGQILVAEKLISSDGRRARSEYTYDSLGRMTMQKDAISQNTDGSYVFDEKDYSNFAPSGDPQKTVERNVQLATGATAQDITTGCVIDDRGHTLSTTDGRGIVTQTNTYDIAGNTLTTTDKAGVTTTNVYDSVGNLIETYQSATGISGKNNWTTTTYDAGYNVIATSTLASDGTVVETITKTIDNLGREVKSDSSAEVGAQTNVYDAAGNVTSSTSEGTAAGTTTTTQYDALGQATYSVNSLTSGAPTTTSYDAAGDVIKTLTPGQPTETETYDDFGEELTHTTGNVTETTTYDLTGDQITQIETAPGKPTITTTYTYDLTGRVLSTKMDAQTATTNTYNVRGDLLSRTDFDGITTQYSYDAAGNQLTEKIGADPATTKTYDDASRITKQVNADGGRVEYTYDGLSRVIEQKEYDRISILKDMTTTYDSAGRIVSTSDSVMSHSMTYTYSTTGTGTSAQTVTTLKEVFADGSYQISTVNGSVFSTAQVTRDGLFASTTESFDAGGRPATRKSVATTTSTLSYDTLGRLTNDTDLSTGAAYSYDPSDSKLNSTNYSSLSQSASYTYSADRTQLTSAKVGSTTTGYTYNSAGDITSAGTTNFTYDANGRLATRTGNTAPYTYDSLGRRTWGPAGTLSWAGQTLITTKQNSVFVSYGYDASGQRVRRQMGTNITSYVYDGIKLAYLTITDTNSMQALTYLYGSGTTPVGAVYKQDTNVPLFFKIVSDQRGDVRELRDTLGAVFARYDYDAYGNITSTQTFATTLLTLAQAQAVSAAQPLRYAGYVWDPESKLYYCSQRYYDPSTASFISRDPAKADGEKSPYLYCAGEPVGKTDPSGCYSSRSATISYSSISMKVKLTGWWETGAGGSYLLFRVHRVGSITFCRSSATYSVTQYRCILGEIGEGTNGILFTKGYSTGWYTVTNPSINTWGVLPIVITEYSAPWIRRAFRSKSTLPWVMLTESAILTFAVDLKVKKSGQSTITTYRFHQAIWGDLHATTGVMKQ